MNPNLRENPDQASWENMDNLIKSTEKFLIDDDTPWNPFGKTPFNNLAHDFFNGNGQNTYNPNMVQRPQTLPYGINVTKSKSENVYSNSPTYFSPGLKQQKQRQPQQPMQNFSPTLRPGQQAFANNPVLRLEIVSSQQYNLDRQDIFTVFSKYGNVLDVMIHHNGTAFVIFADIMGAIDAQKALNEQYVKESNVKLLVTWCNKLENEFARETNRPKVNMSISTQRYKDESPVASPGYSSTSTSPSIYHTLKYTCKYEVQIENDKEFQVARKIIGSKGYNMKKIIEVCQKKINNSALISQNDFLKLRLRGRGSGFKEGPEKRESDEPLHLCISSKHEDVYRLSCEFVEDLLNSIYQDYKAYCERTGRKYPENLQIKRIESVPNKENYSPTIRGNENKDMSSKLINLQYAGSDDQSETNSTSASRSNPALIQQLIGELNRARQTMNFADANRIQEQLSAMGVSVDQDAKGGMDPNAWRFSPYQ